MGETRSQLVFRYVAALVESSGDECNMQCIPDRSLASTEWITALYRFC